MKDYTNKNPKYTGNFKILETTDTDHADNFNVPLKQLADNELYLKEAVDDTKDSTTTFVHSRTRENIKSGEKHSTICGKIARYLQDLKLVAFTGSYDDLSGRPQSMAPSAHKHGKADITDFPSSMPASDVKAWAKAANKPSYSWSEIGDKPQSFPPSSHTHDYAAASHKHAKSDITDFPQSMPASDVYLWAKAASKPSYNWSEIKEKPQSFPPSSHAHDYAASNHSHDTAYVKKTSGYATDLTVMGSLELIDPGNGSWKWEFKQQHGDVYALYFGRYHAPQLYADAYGNAVNIMATENDTVNLGGDGDVRDDVVCGRLGEVRCNAIYANSGSITLSDKNAKCNINEITDEFAEKIIDGLVPKSYRYKDGTSGRTHFGLVSQDVAGMLEKSGIDTKDFAPLVKNYPGKASEDSNGRAAWVKDYGAEPVLHLRYEEFTGIMIKYIQMLKNRQQEMETKMLILEKRIKALEKIINQGA